MKVLIIGNGFDLDLRLNTRYSDFARSKEWADLYSHHNKKGNSLSAYLFEKSEKEWWFDIERCIAEYVKEKEEQRDFSHSETDEKYFVELKKALDDYISSETLNNKCDNKSLAARFLEEQTCFDKIYCFNYTIYEALPYVGYNNLEPMRPIYIHNECYSDGKIVFGIGERDCMSQQYEFLKKINQSLKKTSIIPDLLMADEVVFFGHSLCFTDWNYFERFFKNCSEEWDREPVRNIIFINKDGRQEDVKRNIVAMGANYTEIASICNVEYISSEKYEIGHEEEIKKVSQLLNKEC